MTSSLRILGPVVIGMSAVQTWRFVVFNIVGAAIWAVSVTLLGFLFGQVLQSLLADAERHEALLVVLIVGAGVVLAIVHRLRAAKHRRGGQLETRAPRHAEGTAAMVSIARKPA